MTSNASNSSQSQRLAHTVGQPLPGTLCPEGSLAQLLIRAAELGTKAGITFIKSEHQENFRSYADILHQSRRRLSGLRQAGLSKGDLVMLCLQHSEDFVVSFWATLLGGMVPVPMAYPAAFNTPNHALAKLHGVWEQLGQPLLLTDSGLADHLDQIRAVLAVDELTAHSMDDLAEAAEPLDFSPGHGGDLAFLQYSSGSTGIPKGVMLTHANLLANIEAIVLHLGLKSEDRFLSWMPYHHDMGLIGFHLAPLAVGGQQFNLSPLRFVLKPILWLEKIHQHRAGYTGSPNFGYRHVLAKLKPAQLARWDLSCLKLIFNGAEPISVPAMREFMATLAPCGLAPTVMYPVYGMAEACLGASFPPLGDLPLIHGVDRQALAREGRIQPLPEDHPQALAVADEGLPLPGMEIRIADEHDEVMAEDRVGHVLIRGPNVTAGYYRNPEATHAALRSGWLDTGDLGFMRDGRLCVTGRTKDIIFVNGQNFFAHDVEHQAELVAGVQPGKVAACGWHDATTGMERTVLFLVVKPPRGKTLEEVLARVLAQVNQVLGIPLDYLVTIKTVPKTTSGKVQRYLLHQEFQDGLYTNTTYSAADLMTPATPLQPTRTLNRDETLIREVWAEVLERPIATVTVDQPFMSQGGTSLKAVQVLSRLEATLGRELDHDILIQCHTVREMAAWLAAHSKTPAAADRPTTEAGLSDIAILATACRFPGAADPETYWDNLEAGRTSVDNLPPGRWGANCPEEAVRGGFLDDPYGFDAGFFNIPEKVATSLDPQQRLFLEIAWETLERGAVAGRRSDGQRVGLFIGASHNHYLEHLIHDQSRLELERFESFRALPENQRQALLAEWRARFGHCPVRPDTMVDNLLNMIAARVSHSLNLKGPSLALDSACSSSLVAVRLACDSLRQGECEMALAGGISLALTPTPYLLFQRAGTLAADGRCKVFDATADGFALGEGGGAVLLAPLDKALAEGLPILAVIKGSAVNNDGRSLGTMAPNPDGQRKVIEAAYRDHGLAPGDIQYLEAHGTGTAIGDPSEVRALAQAFAGVPAGHCAIGSAKANLGHLLAAAGIAGLIKVVMALHRRRMAPNIDMNQPNPLINFSATPFYTLDRALDWPAPVGKPRRAAVNAFGFGGTNCHLVVEEAPALPEAAAEEPALRLLCLSAASESALQQRCLRLGEHLRRHPETRFDAVCRSEHLGRAHLPWRASLLAESTGQLTQLLFEPCDPRRADTAKVALMLTGQGAQYPAMTRQLYQTLPAFRRVVDECAGHFDRHLDKPLLATLHDPRLHADHLARTELAQPALFTVDYALGRLLLDWGLKPACLLGHSVGELAAACLAGVMSLADAAKMVCARGRLMQALPARGGMAAVFAPREELELALRHHEGRLWFAAHNGPHQVLSGELDALHALERDLIRTGRVVRPLRVSHAFHTPLMEPMLEDFGRILDQMEFAKPSLPLLSNVSGDWVGEAVLDKDYWQRHVLAPVCFEQGVNRAASEAKPDGTEPAVTAFLECGPDKVLVNLVRSILDKHPVPVLSSLDRRRDDLRCLWEAVGGVYRLGVNLDWQRLEGNGRVICLPSYPFEHRSYRLDPVPEDRTPAAPIPESRPPAATEAREHAPAHWFHRWTWDAQEPGTDAGLDPGAVLIFDDNQKLGLALADHFSAALNPVFRVQPGAGFASLGEGRFTINPRRPDDYQRLLEAVLRHAPALAAVIHLWNRQADQGPVDDEDLYSEVHSVLFLGQTLARCGLNQPLRLLLVTHRAQSTAPGDALKRPQQSLAIALTQVLGQELPGLQAQVVDGDDTHPRELAELLYRELRTVVPEPSVVAIRSRRRLVRRLLDFNLSEAPLTDSRLNTAIPIAGETCLITGGAEGVGAQVALTLARRGVNLILTGRRPLPPRQKWDTLPPSSRDRRIALIEDIEALGVRVDYRAADVTDRHAMAEVVASAGVLHGVMHAAGVVDRKTLRLVDKTTASVERVLAPKVRGTWLLDELTREQPLKCFVLFSSISATSPDWSPSLGDYAAANAFLDAFAQFRAGCDHPGRGLAINWSLWEDCGLGGDAGLKLLVRSKGLQPLPIRQATAALLDALELTREPVLHVLNCLPEAPEETAARSISLIDLAPTAGGHGELVRTLLARKLGVDLENLDETRNFHDLGLDSLDAVELTRDLGEILGRTLYPTLLFEYQSPQALIEYLDEQQQTLASVPQRTVQPAAPPHEALVSETGPLPAPATATVPRVRPQDIAIIGMTCRVPGADSLEDFWELLISGRSVIGEVPSERWNPAEYFGRDGAQHTSYSKWGGFLERVYDFDPQFFGISPREATAMDPQQRLFLESAWDALQQSGYGGPRRNREVGVFVGCEQNYYGEHFVHCQHYEALRYRFARSAHFQQMSEAARRELLDSLREVLQPAQLSSDVVAGNGLNEIPARLSHWLDLRGPSLIVNTACSSALVALHLACESLRSGESELAIAGGVYLNLGSTPFVFMSRVTALSPSGVCTPFGKAADGLVLGEGAAAMVLKPMHRALADGDPIHAVIKGSAINNDGHSSGLTAPNPTGQADAIRKAYRSAGIDPQTVSYVECHGTGTPLGDPVEVEGMTQAFRSFTDRTGFCGIGSVKSTIGHMLSAAGLPSVIKVVLAMQHRFLPPTVNYREPNPHIDFAASPFYVVEGKGQVWEKNDTPLRAGVNAFGFGGTNCHLILEQPPEQQVETGPLPQLLCLSARNEGGLVQLGKRLRRHIEARPELDPAALCLSNNGAQLDLPHKMALLIRDRSHLLAQLVDLEQGGTGAERWSSKGNPKRPSPVVLVLDDDPLLDNAAVTSLGRRFPVFAAACAQAGTVLDPVREAALVQQYALGRLLQTLHIRPTAVCGEGRGMLAGACLTGLLNLEQAATLVNGEVVAAPAPPEEDWNCPLLTPQGQLDPTRAVEDLDCWLGKTEQDPSATFQATPEQISKDAVYLHLGATGGLRQRLGAKLRWVTPAGDQPTVALLTAIGRLYSAGVVFDYRPLAGAGKRLRRISLPSYPFERKTFVYTPLVETIPEPTAPPIPTQPAPVPETAPVAMIDPRPPEAEPVNTAAQPPILRRTRPATLAEPQRRSSHAALMRDLSTLNL